MSRIPRTLAVAVTLAICATGTLSACGDDDDATDSTTTSTEAPAADSGDTDSGDTSDPGTEGGEGADLASFCDPYVDTTIMMMGEPDPTALTENVELINANAPDEIAESAGVMTDAVTKILESGGEDFSPLESPEFATAQGVVDPFVFENCEFDSTAEVTGQDYSFEGIPDEMTSGRNAILFTNEGGEAHELVIMRRADGVTESVDELLALPEEEAMQKVVPVGGAFASTTGGQGLLVGDFEPGEYIALCFIPVGTTAGDSPPQVDGEPHFAHGMQAEFTVS